MTDKLKANPHCCEEAHWTLSKEKYVPCNAPATHVVQQPGDGGARMIMCEFHASHSVENRGFGDLGEYVRPEDAPAGPAADPVYDYSGFDTPSVDTTTELGRLSALAEEARQAEDAVEEAQRELKRRQGVLQGLVEQQIPEIMERVGMMKFTTTGGLNIDLKEIIRASLGSGVEKESNLNWLEANGHEAIIKMSVVVPYGRGDDERARAVELAQELQGRGIDASFERKVEPQTLGALVRELLEEGRPVPEDSFHVFRQRVAKIK